MAAVEIRRAHADELPVVQQLNSELLEAVAPTSWASLDPQWSYGDDGVNYFEGVISGQSGVCLVAVVGNNIVGYLAGRVRQPVPYRPIRRSELENMYVRPDQRHHGAGSKLVEAFLAWSKEQKAQRCVVDTYAISEDAKLFYKKRGFSSDTVEMETKIS